VKPGVERTLKVSSLTATAIAMLAISCGSRPPMAAPFSNADVASAIRNSLPRGWHVEETKADQIPYGHDQTLQHGGQLLVVVGPQDAYFDWQGRDDVWHHDPVFHEALNIWIMPPEYSDSWGNFFDFHRPVGPALVWSGAAATVYGRVTNRLKAGADLSSSISLAKYTSAREVQASWPEWKEEVRDQLSRVIHD